MILDQMRQTITQELTVRYQAMMSRSAMAEKLKWRSSPSTLYPPAWNEEKCAEWEPGTSTVLYGPGGNNKPTAPSASTPLSKVIVPYRAKYITITKQYHVVQLGN
jgi:hypothetical protein